MLSSERSNIPVCMDPYGDKNYMHPVLGSYLLKVIYYLLLITAIETVYSTKRAITYYSFSNIYRIALNYSRSHINTESR